ncbi:DUF2339 domain-containing protein [Shewanella corallii]|uniref:DUF2339 domain-containing protein n=1 Tax=Shewanella corallii TaxID=560080 RepID=A0ABT0N356_9GAMM|nr:DUF2339 domain-containing protein [Shewanella corallii]MCL2912780.1 DUF2339 domain-containing protein [Shewanella corallii]
MEDNNRDKSELQRLARELERVETLQQKNHRALVEHLAGLKQQLFELESRIMAGDQMQASESLKNPVVDSAPVSEQLIADNTSAPEQSPAHQTHPDNPKTDKAAKQSAISASLSGVGEQLGNALGQSLMAVNGPFARVFDQVLGWYRHYQQKGQGPVLLMTLAGIITLIIGFGYLLQYSFTHWLSEMGKVGLATLVSNLIIGTGIFVQRRHSGLADYSSGLMGLGVVLNFLCIYFVGPYYGAIPDVACFGLMFGNTLLGYGLAYRYQTRVVALVAAVGGSLAPLLLFSSQGFPLIYFPYLLLLGIGALFQARRIDWHPLLESTALVQIGAVQWLAYRLVLPLDNQGLMGAVVLVSIAAQFFLFGVIPLLLSATKQTEENKLPLRHLLLGVSVLVLSISAIMDYAFYSGYWLAACAGFISLLFVKYRKYPQLSAFLVCGAAAMAGFAALYFIGLHYLGAVLLLEAFLLLWLGCREQNLAVRVEAYVLYVIATATSLFSLISGFEYLVLGVLQARILFLTVVSLLFFSLHQSYRQLQSYASILAAQEQKAVWVIGEGFSLFGGLAVILLCYLITPDYWLNMLPVASALWFVFALKEKLKLAQWLAWGGLFGLFVPLALGAMEVGSMRFSTQPLVAKLARLELFTALMLAYPLYLKYMWRSSWLKTARLLFITCLALIPLFFLPKVAREFESLLPATLWLSLAISLKLAHMTGYKLLRTESQWLFAAAVTLTAIAVFAADWQGAVALVIGLLFTGVALKQFLVVDKRWRLLLKEGWYFAPYYGALVIVALVFYPTYALGSGLTFIALALSAYFMLLILGSGKLITLLSRPLRSSLGLAYGLVFGAAVAPVVVHWWTLPLKIFVSPIDVLVELAVLVLMAWFLTQKSGVARLFASKVNRSQLWVGWNLMLFASYLLWGQEFAGTVSGPLITVLMVLHASVLMYFSLRPGCDMLLKLAGGLYALVLIKLLAFDMTRFAMIHKIGAFMLCGAILLLVSFYYQKARNQRLAQSAAEDETA